jgi:hypothetical protein
MIRRLLLGCAGVMLICLPLLVHAQDEPTADIVDVLDESYPTLFSMKISAGYGLGRARQLYGHNGGSEVYWSAGEGVKLDAGFVIPLLPVDVVNLDGEEFGPERFPVVGFEMEVASGYHLSTGGTTFDTLPTGEYMRTERTASYVPVTIGFNARATLGAGLPSVFVGAGGGVHLRGIYRDDITFTNSTARYERRFDPPIPFALYGVLGVELPLLYSPDEGNSFIDLFAQVKLIEATNYIYEYQFRTNDGGSAVMTQGRDPYLLYVKESARSASSASLSLGFKINLY